MPEPTKPDVDLVQEELRDVARSVIEAVLCGLIDGVAALAAAGASTGGRLVVVGGGARMAAVPQVLADLAGRPIEVCDTEELVALGAARQAAAVLTGEWPAWSVVIAPTVARKPTCCSVAVARFWAEVPAHFLRSSGEPPGEMYAL